MRLDGPPARLHRSRLVQHDNSLGWGAQQFWRKIGEQMAVIAALFVVGLRAVSIEPADAVDFPPKPYWFGPN